MGDEGWCGKGEGFGEVLLSLCLGFNFVLWLWMEVRYFG